MAKKKKAAAKAASKSNGAGAKKSGGKRGGVERARYMQDLPCPISDKQQATKARELSAAYRRREAALDARREDMARHKKTLDGIDEQMKTLSDSVENGTEQRSVEVVEYLVIETNEIRVVRTDTDQLVETRTAEAADRQEGLFGGDAKAARAAKARKSADDEQAKIAAGDDDQDEDDEPSPEDLEASATPDVNDPPFA